MPFFTLISKSHSSGARLGRLHLPHGEVDTPVFMPVGTCGTIKACTFDQIRQIGYNLILSNTYHLYLRPGMETLKQFGGLHRFSTWDRNLLTDSGGFQVFSLSDIRKVDDDGVMFSSFIDGSRHRFTPESVVESQKWIGSDIMMPLDECTPVPVDRAVAERAMKRTATWLLRSRIHWEKECDTSRQYLFGIVQGNVFGDLRKDSARMSTDLDLPGYSIGGLSVGEEKTVMYDMVELTASLLPDEKPRYLMGVGKPEDLVEGVYRGIDMFDCIFPTRVGRNGSFFTRTGVRNIKNAGFKLSEEPLDAGCDCMVCHTYTRGYIRHLFRAGEITAMTFLSIHNLAFLHRLMAEIRKTIAAGTFEAWRNDFLGTYMNVEDQF